MWYLRLPPVTSRLASRCSVLRDSPRRGYHVCRSGGHCPQEVGLQRRAFAGVGDLGGIAAVARLSIRDRGGPLGDGGGEPTKPLVFCGSCCPVRRALMRKTELCLGTHGPGRRVSLGSRPWRAHWHAGRAPLVGGWLHTLASARLMALHNTGRSGGFLSSCAGGRGATSYGRRT